jgi:type I site-specific restriction endonuclease
VTHAQRAERHQTISSENVLGETVYSYSRKQAIEDGVLVDLSQIDSIKQHWKYPLLVPICWQ